MDDRKLTEMLREIRDADDIGLLGTGFDDAMLANLLMVTRPLLEIADANAAAEWVGMPEMSGRESGFQLLLRCDTAEERDDLIAQLDLQYVEHRSAAWFSRWPSRMREDKHSVRFEG